MIMCGLLGEETDSGLSCTWHLEKERRRHEGYGKGHQPDQQSGEDICPDAELPDAERMGGVPSDAGDVPREDDVERVDEKGKDRPGADDEGRDPDDGKERIHREQGLEKHFRTPEEDGEAVFGDPDKQGAFLDDEGKGPAGNLLADAGRPFTLVELLFAIQAEVVSEGEGDHVVGAAVGTAYHVVSFYWFVRVIS